MVCPLAFCSGVNSNSFLDAFSLYTTGIPSRSDPNADEYLAILMPFCLSKRILTPSGSASASEMSLMWTLVGSAFAPAPVIPQIYRTFSGRLLSNRFSVRIVDAIKHKIRVPAEELA